MGQGLLVRRGGQGGQSSYVFGSLSVSENGIYLPSSYSLDAFSRVDVNVLPSYTSMAISITENGLYKPQDYNVDAFSEVDVNVQDGMAKVLQVQSVYGGELYNSDVTYLRIWPLYSTTFSSFNFPNVSMISYTGVGYNENPANMFGPFVSPYPASLPITIYMPKLQNVPLAFFGSSFANTSRPFVSITVSSVANITFTISSYGQGNNINGALYYKCNINGKSVLGFGPSNTTQWNNIISSLWSYDSENYSLTIDSNTGYIAAGAFTSYSTIYSSVHTLVLPEVIAIASNAMYILSYLTAIYAPNCIALYSGWKYSTGGSTLLTAVFGDLEIVDYYALGGNNKNLSTLGRSRLTKLSYIGYGAFYNQNNLDIEINAATIIIASQSAFYNCSKLKFYNNFDNLSGTLPAFSHTKISSCIAPLATQVVTGEFYDCQDLSIISLPNVLVPNTSFATGCSNLKEVYCENFMYLSNLNFSGCSNLQILYIPNVSSYYGSNIFAGCSNLSSLTININNINIETSYPVFSVLSQFSNIIGTTTYCSLGGISNLVLTKYGNDTTAYFIDGGISTGLPTNFSFPNLKAVPYACKSSTTAMTTYRIDLPECLSIGGYAFANNRNTSYVSIPKCKYIGPYAFAALNYLNDTFSYTAFSFPEVEYIGGHAFSGQQYFKGNNGVLSLPKCSYIGAYTFANTYLIRSLYAPECLSIATSAFYGCSSLSKVTLPKVKYIGNDAFEMCSSLVEFSVSTLTDNAHVLGTYALYNCQNLKSINVGIYAVESDFSTIASFYGSNAIGGSVFAENHQLEYISIYGYIPLIPIAMLEFAFSLPKFSISLFRFASTNYSTAIQQRAFHGCSALSKVYIKYGDSTISYTMASIYGSVFSGCNSLQSLYIRHINNGSTGVGICALANSSVFTSTPMLDDTLTGSFGSIYVPASQLASYKTATNWVYFSNRLVGLTDEEFDAVEANW